MMSNLASIIPGANAWPKFTRNQSEQYEARFVTVQVEHSPSIFFAGMEGSAHSDRRGARRRLCRLLAAGRHRRPRKVALRFVDNNGAVTEAYPLNPNGSPDGITSVTTADGRFTALMPHPERVFQRSHHELGPGCLEAGRRRRQPVDAHVPQRPEVGRLIAARRLTD